MVNLGLTLRAQEPIPILRVGYQLKTVYLHSTSIGLTCCIGIKIPTQMMKKTRTSIDYDSDGLIISYHRNYDVARKNKAKYIFSLTQQRKNCQTNLTHKQSKEDNGQVLNVKSIVDVDKPYKK